jgi:hypothetical protein
LNAVAEGTDATMIAFPPTTLVIGSTYDAKIVVVSTGKEN